MKKKKLAECLHNNALPSSSNFSMNIFPHEFKSCGIYFSFSLIKFFLEPK